MHIYFRITVVFIALWMPLVASAGRLRGKDRVYVLPEDKAVFGNYLAAMQGKEALPFDSVIMHTARFFIGTPYVGGTLEIEPEGLAVNLRELDCFTFVETVISLSRMFASGDKSWERFCDELRTLRYRNGRVRAYLDRLHYTSDWMFENERRGAVRLLDAESAGARPYRFDLSFMSTHTGSYKQLGADSAQIRKLQRIERSISRRKSYAYIPEAEIDSLSPRLKDGDVVGFLTTVKGLDISHVGIVSRAADGSLAFIHASQTAAKVILNPETIYQYVAQRKSCNGVILVRPLSPELLSAKRRQSAGQAYGSSAWRNLQTRLYRKYDSLSRILLRNK